MRAVVAIVTNFALIVHFTIGCGSFSCCTAGCRDHGAEGSLATCRHDETCESQHDDLDEHVAVGHDSVEHAAVEDHAFEHESPSADRPDHETPRHGAIQSASTSCIGRCLCAAIVERTIAVDAESSPVAGILPWLIDLTANPDFRSHRVLYAPCAFDDLRPAALCERLVV